MNSRTRLVLALSATLIFLSESAGATMIQRINVSGQLGNSPIVANQPWDGSSISGFFEIDLDASFFNSGGIRQYNFTDWMISITPTGAASTLQLNNDGESHDGGYIALNRFSDRVGISLDEDIDNPVTAGIEDRTLQMSFTSGVDINTSTTLPDIFAGDPNFGTSGSFYSGAFQFSTSQLSTLLTTGSITPVTASAPEPAPLGLIGLGLVILALRK